ncbi:MAG: molybdate ABC transporter substrate-binding protein [Rhodoferax sp.]
MNRMSRRSCLRGMAAGALLPLGMARAQTNPPEMLLYCGITMVRPMTEIAHAFEQAHGVRIRIAQGGSADLYQSAYKSRVGDWYLPGEPSYYHQHKAEGLLGRTQVVGYNQMAMVVRKGNPKGIKADPRELLRPDLTVILGSAESGSVGREAKAVLDRLGIYPQVVRNTAFLAPDSRSLLNAMKRGEADLTLSWRATAMFPDNASAVDALDLPVRLAQPQPLLLVALNTSQQTALRDRFMDDAASEPAQAVFRRYGFLDNRSRVQ